MMRVLPYRPLQANYSVEPRDGVMAIELEGGSSRLGIVVQGGTSRVNVAWALPKQDYDVLSAFHRMWKRTLEPFHADLIIDSGSLDRYEASFVPDSFQLTEKHGSTIQAVAQFEVVPLNKYLDEETDEAGLWLDLVLAYGSVENVQRMTNRLEKLVNVDWPNE